MDLSLSDLTRDLEALRDETLARIADSADTAALEALELEVLGKKGRLTATLRGIGGLPAEDRPRVGAVANAVRVAIGANRSCGVACDRSDRSGALPTQIG